MHPLPEYPRPSMRRDSYVNLNGPWDYAITQSSEFPAKWDGAILVPYSPEAKASGVGRTLQPGQWLHYHRTFTPPAGEGGRVLLHFGAVDYACAVEVNGRLAGGHRGGYWPFTLDITDLLRPQGRNTLWVAVQDPTGTGVQARGKQTLRPGGMFYPAQSGIWQTVWLERVPENYIDTLTVIPDYDARTVTVKAHTAKPGGAVNLWAVVRAGGVTIAEDWGGDTIMCPVSAKTGEGVDELLEMILLQADTMELRANPNRLGRGVIIEAKLDKARGPLATVLMQNGTLHVGDNVVAGLASGRVRAMVNDKGERVNEAGPSFPVEIMGLSEAPNAGDVFNAVADERMARELVEERKQQKKDAANAGSKKVSLDDLFSRIQQGEMKDFNIIVKADVQGSAEAVKSSLEKLSNDEVRVQVIHSGVGAINESDVMLAATSNAIIVGFNVRPDAAARDNAARSNVEIRMYRVIYDCINEIEAAMKGMLAPKFQEQIIGHVEIRQTFKVSKVGTVCGGYVTDGKIVRNSKVRVVRDNIVVFEGDLASLRRFKDDVKEVAAGYECGLQVDKYNDVKVGDVIEVYVMEEIKQ